MAALYVILLGSVVGLCGVLGMIKHTAKAYGYLLYCLGLFSLGTITMIDSPSLGSICLAGLCYLFALLSIFGAAFGQRKEGANAQQPVDEGQGDGVDAEEGGCRKD